MKNHLLDKDFLYQHMYQVNEISFIVLPPYTQNSDTQSIYAQYNNTFPCCQEFFLVFSGEFRWNINNW